MKKEINQKTLFPMLAALICVLLLIASAFLPYYTAMDEYVELLESTEQDPSMSLYDFAKMYLAEGVNSLAMILYIVGGLTALATLFVVFRKPIPVIIFDIPITGFMTLTYLIFTSDHNPYYNLAIASTLIFAACAGLLVSAIWMLIAKIIAKKRYIAANQ